MRIMMRISMRSRIVRIPDQPSPFNLESSFSRGRGKLGKNLNKNPNENHKNHGENHDENLDKNLDENPDKNPNKNPDENHNEKPNCEEIRSTFPF